MSDLLTGTATYPSPVEDDDDDDLAGFVDGSVFLVQTRIHDLIDRGMGEMEAVRWTVDEFNGTSGGLIARCGACLAFHQTLHAGRDAAGNARAVCHLCRTDPI